MKKLFSIGNRVFDLSAVTHVSYDPNASLFGLQDPWAELTVSFGGDDCTMFYGKEAEEVWHILLMHPRKCDRRRMPHE